MEQVRVNSLTHMVVVVDENSGDSATAALESKLQVRIHTHTHTTNISWANFISLSRVGLFLLYAFIVASSAHSFPQLEWA